MLSQDRAAKYFMNFDNIKEQLVKLFEGNLSDKDKIYTTISLAWIMLIGYLTWWNGLNSSELDKSFKWDEWFWFGIVPAIAPYLFYFIWKKRD